MTEVQDDDAVPSVDDTLRSSERLQFRLSQLLVLISLIAVFLAIGGRPLQLSDQLTFPLFEYIHVASTVVFAILNAAAITAAGYHYFDRRRDKLWQQPGHWLVLSIAVLAIFSLVQSCALRLLWSSGDFDMGWTTQPPLSADSPSFARAILLIVLSIASLGFQIAFNIYIGRQQTERRWASVFYLNALSPFLWMLGPIVCLFWLIRVTVLDRRDGHARDSLHRFGIGLELAYYVATIMLSLGTFWMMIFFI